MGLGEQVLKMHIEWMGWVCIKAPPCSDQK